MVQNVSHYLLCPNIKSNLISTQYFVVSNLVSIVAFEKKKIATHWRSKKISNDKELIQSDPTSCLQNQKGNQP